MAENKTDISKKKASYDALSFGRYLKALRKERGIRLASISDVTRINYSTLQNIEDENHDALPDEVFVKGFLRSYAEIVGANPDEAVQRYLANCHLRRQVARFEADLIRSEKRFWPRLITSLGALFCLIILTVWVASPPSSARKRIRKTSPVAGTPMKTESTPVSHPTIEPPIEQLRPAAAAREMPHTLCVVCVKETWLKVMIDEQTPKKFTLNPGDRLELTAKTKFNLMIGNADGVELTLNGTPCPVPGRQGQIVTLQLP